MVDAIEESYGSSPSSTDTDGDGLTDYFEISVGQISHWVSAADSDEDGSPDGLEDVDNDDLNALAEQAHGTDPRDADTDDDRAGDGSEVTAGTDPLVPDQPVQTSVVSAGAVTVSLTGNGNLSGSVRIGANDEAFFTGAPGQVGPAVDIDLDDYGAAHLQSASVTFAYDETAAPGNEADLRIFTWDEEQLVWTPAGDDITQQVDVTANTVTVDVEHFSTFGLFDIAAWVAFWNAAIECESGGGGGEESVPVEVALVIDSSGSMTSNDPTGLRKTAAKSFVDLLRVDAPDPDDRDRAAVVSFASSASLLRALTSDTVALKSSIDTIGASGGTNLSNGMSLALSHLDSAGRDEASQVIVFLTDGVGTYSTTYTTLAANRGVIVFTIGLGTGVDQALLQGIANGAGGQYFPVASADQLEDVFLEIGGEVTNED